MENYLILSHFHLKWYTKNNLFENNLYLISVDKKCDKKGK